MSAYGYYMVLAKQATESLLDSAMATPMVAEAERLADPRNSAAYRVSGYLHDNKQDLARGVGRNVAYGIMANRAVAPVSIGGSSVGGVIDGLLLKPMIDGGVQLVGRGLRAFDREKPAHGTSL